MGSTPRVVGCVEVPVGDLSIRVSNLEASLRSLRRQHRIQVSAFVAALLLLLLLGSSGLGSEDTSERSEMFTNLAAKTVIAENFLLAESLEEAAKDPAKWKPAAELRVHEKGRPMLKLTGRRYISTIAETESGMALAVGDSPTRLRFVAGVNGGLPEVSLYGTGTQMQARIQALPTGGALSAFDLNGNPRALLGVLTGDGPALLLMDTRGNVTTRMP